MPGGATLARFRALPNGVGTAKFSMASFTDPFTPGYAVVGISYVDIEDGHSQVPEPMAIASRHHNGLLAW